MSHEQPTYCSDYTPRAGLMAAPASEVLSRFEALEARQRMHDVATEDGTDPPPVAA